MIELTRRRIAQAGLAAMILAPGAVAAQSLARPRADLYDCEGCEALFERDAAGISVTARLDAEDAGEPFVLRGRALSLSGAPLAGVIVYAHHANGEGYYANGAPQTVWSRRHGRLRGWAKTGADGVYEFRTIKPAPYPNMTMPAHIHLTTLEPGRRPYWIDDVVFEGEFGVDAAYRRDRQNRGGDGVVVLRRLPSGEWLAERDIFLEPHPV